MLAVPPGFSSVPIPRVCSRKSAEAVQENGGVQGVPTDCPQDPYVIIPDRCEYVDQQVLKLQEAPEEVPTGELPRNILVTVGA